MGGASVKKANQKRNQKVLVNLVWILPETSEVLPIDQNKKIVTAPTSILFWEEITWGEKNT